MLASSYPRFVGRYLTWEHQADAGCERKQAGASDSITSTDLPTHLQGKIRSGSIIAYFLSWPANQLELGTFPGPEGHVKPVARRWPRVNLRVHLPLTFAGGATGFCTSPGEDGKTGELKICRIFSRLPIRDMRCPPLFAPTPKTQNALHFAPNMSGQKPQIRNISLANVAKVVATVLCMILL